MRTLRCPTCGTVWRVLKEATTGAEIEYFDCCAGREAPRQTIEAKVIRFPAASERLGTAAAQAGDVTRRGDSSCREVPDGLIGEFVLLASPDELSGGGR
jgi:hypothetical protein